MSTVDPPEKRRCTHCGRAEVWDDDESTWVGADSDPGQPHCVHEWDITGNYNPFARES